MATRVGVIGVPSSAGAHAPGQEAAPAALRSAGLLDRLAAAGIDVGDLGDLPIELARPDRGASDRRNKDAVLRTAGRVADAVESASSGGGIPLVLGGDCTITLGVLAGLRRHHPELALVYLDGDADLDEPGLGWGVFDSMGISHAIGRGDTDLAGLGDHRPLVDEADVTLFGYHPAQLSPTQDALLLELRVRTFPCTELSDPVEAARTVRHDLERRGAAVVVHLDVDVIAFHDLPLADCPRFHDGALTFDDVMACLGVFLGLPRLAAVTLTEVNPGHDPEGRLVPRLVEGFAGAWASAGGRA